MKSRLISVMLLALAVCLMPTAAQALRLETTTIVPSAANFGYTDLAGAGNGDGAYTARDGGVNIEGGDVNGYNVHYGIPAEAINLRIHFDFTKIDNGHRSQYLWVAVAAYQGAPNRPDMSPNTWWPIWIPSDLAPTGAEVWGIGFGSSSADFDLSEYDGISQLQVYVGGRARGDALHTADYTISYDLWVADPWDTEMVALGDRVDALEDRVEDNEDDIDDILAWMTATPTDAQVIQNAADIATILNALRQPGASGISGIGKP